MNYKKSAVLGLLCAMSALAPQKSESAVYVVQQPVYAPTPVVYTTPVVYSNPWTPYYGFMNGGYYGGRYCYPRPRFYRSPYRYFHRPPRPRFHRPPRCPRPYFRGGRHF